MTLCVFLDPCDAVKIPVVINKGARDQIISPEGMSEWQLGINSITAAAKAKSCTGSSMESDKLNNLDEKGFESCEGRQ